MASQELTITERLRQYAGFPLVARGYRGRLIRAAMLDAAREIDRLAELARLDICPTCKKHVPSPCVARQNTVGCEHLE